MSTIYIKNIKNDNQITTGRLFDEQPNSIQCNIRVDVINHIAILSYHSSIFLFENFSWYALQKHLSHFIRALRIRISDHLSYFLNMALTASGCNEI
jgi:hypothetical protein